MAATYKNGPLKNATGIVTTYLRGVLISLWSVKNGTSDVVRHSRHFVTALCDPQHLVGCLVIHGEIEPVWMTGLKDGCREKCVVEIKL